MGGIQKKPIGHIGYDFLAEGTMRGVEDEARRRDNQKTGHTHSVHWNRRKLRSWYIRKIRQATGGIYGWLMDLTLA